MADFAQILIRAKDETKGAFDSAARNMRGLEAGAAKLNSVVGALGVGLSAAGFAAFAKQGIDAADALNDMSDRTGVAVKTLAEYKLAATLADTSLESLAKGVQRLTLSIGQAEAGGKAQAEALKTLGITARDPQQAFEQLADAVANSNDPIRTNAALNDLLGRSYTELLPLLQGGAQGLRDSAAASESYAEAMVRLAPEAARINDQLDILKFNASAAATSILAELVPSLNEYIAVGREVVNNGTLLDKVRFFALGNASDEIVDRVRNNLKASAEMMEKLRGSAARANAEAATASTIKLPDKTQKPGKEIDRDALFAEEIAAAWKQADAELERYLDDLAFMADVDAAQLGGVNEIAQQWAEAGRALTDEMMTPLERANVEFGRLDELLARGAISWETYTRAVFDTQAGIETMPEAIGAAKSAAEEFGLTFTSALEDAIVTGESFSDMLKGMEQDIARLIVRKTITEPLMNVDWGAMLGALIPSANGNAFSGVPGLSAYSGTVVSKPTLFPFAAGAGLMGEAGPEAILPLKRGPNGKLGVEGGGSAVQVNVINNASGTQATATEREDNGVRIVDVMVEQVEGAMSRRLGRGEGLAPVMERRYGLNPAGGAY